MSLTDFPRIFVCQNHIANIGLTLPTFLLYKFINLSQEKTCPNLSVLVQTKTDDFLLFFSSLDLFNTLLDIRQGNYKVQIPKVSKIR